MNYELAKELKDAGFPQGRGHLVRYLHGFECAREAQHLADEELWIPTLEELIEAVRGDKMHTFSLDFNEEWSVYEEPNKDGPWSARYYDLTPVGFYECGAKTPAEAVAKLWLTLNKK